jgi:hypothetical protein
VELEHPHEILGAMKVLIEKDPEACVGSRMLLSVVNDPVPSCADWHELAWLYDIGYRRMMLCDELCLKDDLLSTAVNAFQAFRLSYGRRTACPSVTTTSSDPTTRSRTASSLLAGFRRIWGMKTPSA